ncbi:MAG: hypothetical protein PHF50_03550 [Patescibacteria group bacterium]|nr:hypothetical protein [Patescibacteria group bacterium]
MENLDSRLLRNQNEEQKAAQELKEKKRGEAGEEGGDESKSLRQRVQTARQAMNLKETAKEKLKEKALAPAKIGTSQLLQKAWIALLPSWGLSSIWINIHVFLKSIFGEKLFCKLGDEWLPKKATEATGEAGKMITKSFGLVEVMVLIFIDVIIFFVIVSFVAMFTDESTFKAMTGESNKTQTAPAAQQTK